MKLWFFLVALLLCLNSPAGSAHQLSTGYLQISNSQEHSTQGVLQLRLYDLHLAIGLDQNNDGALTWQELLLRRPALLQYLQSSLTFENQNGQCPWQASEQFSLDNYFNETYLHLPLQVQCADLLSINYRALFDVDSHHKLIVTGQISSQVASHQQRTLLLGENNLWRTAVNYLGLGVSHIWMGWDHLLFLVTLLMSIFILALRQPGSNHASLPTLLARTAWLVTSFTLAHSITLTATALGLLSTSTRWVEVIIAASVLLAALNNVWPMVTRLGWLTFGFGLVHGMGFASVLQEIGLDPQHQLLTVLAFNLGVEVGQLLFLALLIPILYGLQQTRLSSRLSYNAVSLVIAAISIQWIVQRV
ncbi:HupE/UreJ family protein [Simiduia aestuariiviva]|uniref:HupE/UreJ family protein n=1 Tax=Simiduia aestuariiviva TaxID=1510459 RepID=A0A839UQM2_9GAMM|nr:HupE/UreJ family protein [Simiduia aestuariiviva]MBB3169031.1 hypothetical protein [Simiduia aestuariiviva]